MQAPLISMMTAAQAATLKRLAHDAYELDAFRPNLTSAEADIRIAMLTAKLKLLGEPPHPLIEGMIPRIFLLLPRMTMRRIDFR